ncbi:hypothetical protein [Acidocella sp. KAb 2-4]|nr:hypothetical protein [Acidocella sp. KAb 2-4]
MFDLGTLRLQALHLSRQIGVVAFQNAVGDGKFSGALELGIGR